jgi:hypothetical protein
VVELHRRIQHDYRNVLAEVAGVETYARNTGLLEMDPALLAPDAVVQFMGREKDLATFGRWLVALAEATQAKE